jgi:hypothetical protein
VTNLSSGIDFYDVSEGKFVTTTHFNPLTPTGSNRLAGIVYVTEDVVVAGHTNGDVVGVLTGNIETLQMFKTRTVSNIYNAVPRELFPQTLLVYH